VQALLLESLYDGSDNRLGVLRALFDARATRDDENGHDCTRSRHGWRFLNVNNDRLDGEHLR
jgi:hypothetical protein